MTNKMAKKAMGLKGFMNSMSKPKMKKGGFPDLTGDGKVTRADILKGRGVFQEGGEIYFPNKNKKIVDKTTFPGGKYKETTKWERSENRPGTEEMVTSMRRTAKGLMSGAPRVSKLSEVDKFKMRQSALDEPIRKSLKQKGQKGMNIMKEAKKNATPSIPNSYYQMGGMKEENPLSGMLKESMKEKAMAKKKAMANNAKGKSMPKGKGKKKMQAGGRFMPGYPAPLMAGNDLQSLG